MLLEVEDNGPGLPPDRLEALQSGALPQRMAVAAVAPHAGGSGLGLTLAQTFVQQHHGLIECDSVPGATDFKILIPLP